MNFTKGQREFLAGVNSRGVELILVGAAAQALNEETSFSGGLDCLFCTSEVNAAKLYELLCDLGFGNFILSAAQFRYATQATRLGFPPNSIDLLPRFKGLTLETVWDNRVPVQLGELSIWTFKG